MEVLAAVSLAGNILQFVDFSYKVVKQAQRYHNSFGGRLQKHVRIEESLDDLDSLLFKLKQSNSSTTPEKTNLNIDPDLLKKIEECIYVGEDLRRALARIQGRGSDGWRKNLRKAFRSIMSEEYIRELQLRLDSVEQDLQLHLSVEQREQLIKLQQGQSRLFEHLDEVALKICKNVLIGQKDVLDVHHNQLSAELRTIIQQENLQVIDSLKATLEPTTTLVRSRSVSPMPSRPSGRDLFEAIRDDRTDVIAHLIKQGANVDFVNDDDDSRPLHVATRRGNEVAVDLLLTNGADVEAVNGHGLTPLMLAARFGRTGVLTRILQDEVHVDAKLQACRPGITSGIDIDNVTTYDSTALTLAALNGHARAVRELIAYGATIDSLTNHRFTPLHAAIQGGHSECARLLLEAGAAVDARTDQGFTPLIYAANLDKRDCAKVLLEFEANTEVKKSHGMTAILEAIWVDNSSMVELLVKGGADMEVTTGISGHNDTPLQLCVRHGNSEIAAVLLRLGANRDFEVENGLTIEESVLLGGDASMKTVFEHYKRSV